MINIPDTILENIFKYRFQEYLKINNLPKTGNIDEIQNRIQNFITTTEQENSFLDFLKDELKYGKNKQIFYKDISLTDLSILNELSKVEHFLALDNVSTTNFNNLLVESPKDQEILFLDITKNSKKHNKVDIIELCIFKEIQAKNTESDVHTNYVWVEINVLERYLTIRVRPHGQPMLDRYTTKTLFNEIIQQLRNIFKLILKSNMDNAKNTFYKMYKEFINSAELPYREEIDNIKTTITDSQKDIFSSLGIETNSKLARDIILRYSRLLERMLIINDLENYSSYQKDRIAMVERISLSDSSGASANVLSGDEDGLDVATIYFDIRDTIDEIQKLNKVWITWFKESEFIPEQISLFPEDNSQSTIKQFPTRFESFKSYVVITFMKEQFVSREVQDFVFSNFRKFEK